MWRLREVARVVDGVAIEWGHRQVAGEVVDGEAEASGARVDAGCVFDSVGAKGTRGASRKAVSSWVVGRPTERSGECGVQEHSTGAGGKCREQGPLCCILCAALLLLPLLLLARLHH